ncbi:MAG: ribosome biogenesis protein [Candidatus Altiarchaeota archaeon]|nr:ribosome biogenesis protein [Candidatus Altiarchaeota archaeon]
MKKCSVCEKYTLTKCSCGGEVRSPEPPKFSPEDKYWKQRLQARGVKV